MAEINNMHGAIRNVSLKFYLEKCRGVGISRLGCVSFFFFTRHCNPSWVSACSTVVEHSQQEGFYRVPLPAAGLTPNLEENQGFRAFQPSPQEAPSV
jgi:hypothetical protein